MKPRPYHSLSLLSLALASALATNAYAQETDSEGQSSRVTASSTSNTTAAYNTKRVQELDKVNVSANKDAFILGGGNMTVQTASKAISTVTREAITKAAGGSNFTQLIDSIPGVDASTSDVTGLNNGNYSLRGFDSSAIGITVNGAPVTDSGSYAIYATEYGDGENYNDITVLQGTPNVDAPEMGATGGQINWSTIDPTHEFGVDFNQGFGSNDYRRTFLRVNTGDTGPIRSWISISKNTADKWKGAGDMDVTKIDGKSLWDISPGNSVSFSFQYNRQSNYSYSTGSKSQIQQDYDYDYDTTWTGSNTTYYKLRRNPYKSLLASLDGEFTLSDTLRLSVVPYVWWGKGGGSSATTLKAATSSSTNLYGYAVNAGDVSGASDVAYTYSYSSTVRPGVIAKFFQDLGTDNSLVYGVWYDRSRKSQHNAMSLVDQATGEPCDVWDDTDSCGVYYANGKRQQSYSAYTLTTTQKYFIQDTWTPNDYWTANLGVSYIHATREGYDSSYPGSAAVSTSVFNNSYNEWLPAAGLKYQMDDSNQFYLGVAKSFRVPPTSTIYTNDFAGTSQSAPETAWTYDLGWRFYGDKVGASLMAYQSNYTNKQMSTYTPDGDSVYTTIPSVRMRGFNGEASYKFTDQWNAYASYTYTEAQVQSQSITSKGLVYPLDSKQLPNTPKNLVNMALNYTQGNFWASLKGRYSGSRWGDYLNTEKVGGYTTLSLNGGYNFSDWGLLKKPYVKVNVSNLTDRKAFTWVSTTQLLASSGVSEYPEIGSGSTPYYQVLQPRAVIFTVGASF